MAAVVLQSVVVTEEAVVEAVVVLAAVGVVGVVVGVVESLVPEAAQTSSSNPIDTLASSSPKARRACS